MGARIGLGEGAVTPTVGEYVSETMVTDTRVYEVVKVTDKTITVRTTIKGDTVKSENVDGNPFPVNYSEAVSDTDGATYVVRLRKDGTYRKSSYSALRVAYRINGKPDYYTDYRF